MIPNIFISSTIHDLQHLRDAVRETIIELGYNPVLSEYGDIGYIPYETAEDSCYVAMRDCQLTILIVGKRYGSKSKNGFSVTHNELRTARSYKLPTICLVDREVISFKRVYDLNKAKGINSDFPGMDSHEDTFALIHEIMTYTWNNAILEFNTATEARQHLKKQMASLFGELLIRRYDPLKLQMQDVLSEVKTLRHELLKDKGSEPLQYMKAIRFLISEEMGYRDYSDLLDAVLDNQIEATIPAMLTSPSFDDFMKTIGVKVEVLKDDVVVDKFKNSKFIAATSGLRRDVDTTTPPSQRVYRWFMAKPKNIILNDVGKNYFDYLHAKFIEITRQ
jgi:hypothetical protein